MANGTPVENVRHFMPNRDDMAIRVLCGAQEDTKSSSLLLHRPGRANGPCARLDGAAASFYVGAQPKTVSPLLLSCDTNL